MTERSNAELGRDIDRVERNLKDHTQTHVSVEAFQALARAVDEIKNGQTWLSRLLVTQSIVLLIGIIVALAGKVGH